MVVYENFFYLCFGQKILTILKEILIDNHYKTIACSSYRVNKLVIFEPHQCLLAGIRKRTARLPCWLPRGRQVWHQRWISVNGLHTRLYQVWINLPTVALEPRGDVTRSPKQEYQWPHKKDSCPPKIKKKRKKVCHLTQWTCPRQQQEFQYNRINQSLHFKITICSKRNDHGRRQARGGNFTHSRDLSFDAFLPQL